MHTSKPSLQAHAPTSEAPRTRAIQSARTPKRIRNLLSRRTSSDAFANLSGRGLLNGGKSILVIPAANAFSMNIHKRFWPVDNTDVNRMFPGYDKGETTQRIAAGIF